MQKGLKRGLSAIFLLMMCSTASAIYVQGDGYNGPVYSQGPGPVSGEWNFTYDFSEPDPLDAHLTIRCDDGCPVGQDLTFNGHSLSSRPYAYADALPDEEPWFRYFIFSLDLNWLAGSNIVQLSTDSYMAVTGAIFSVQGKTPSVVEPTALGLLMAGCIGLRLARRKC